MVRRDGETPYSRTLVRIAAGVAVTLGVSGAAVAIWAYRGYAVSQIPLAEIPCEPADSAPILLRLNPDELTDRPTSPRSDKILLITIDTLRADHLSSYGYPLATTPYIDQIASEGVRFTRAYAPLPMTVPSHASMLTGVYPIQHGVTRNGLRLPDAILTLPEVLRAQGYVTAAFVATNRHFGPGNLMQGFVVADEPATEPDQSLAEELHGYRPAVDTLDRAKRFFEQHRDESRVFAWIHLFDPHLPYSSHPEAEAQLGLGEIVPESEWQRLIRERRGSAPSAEQLARTHRYDAEIRYVDNSLREFFAALPELLDEYLVVIVADHGEGLDDHGRWGHGEYVYQELIHVPAIMRWPDRSRVGVVDEVVELTDLMPTLLWAAAVPPLALATRTLPLEGTPLQSIIDADRPVRLRRFAVAQRRSYAARSFVDFTRQRALSWIQQVKWKPGESFALITAREALILPTGVGETVEYYDLQDDPHELHNAFDPSDPVQQNMKSTLHALVVELASTSDLEAESVTDEELEGLRALGYVQ